MPNAQKHVTQNQRIPEAVNNDIYCPHPGRGPHSPTRTRAQGPVAAKQKQLVQRGGSDRVFLTGTGRNFGIFGALLIPTSGNSLSLAYDFWRHQLEMTQVGLVKETKLNFICMNKLVLSAQAIFKTGLPLLLI